MSTPTGFGVSGSGKNYTSRQTNYSAQTADKTNTKGEIIDQVTHGATKEVQEEYYCDNPAAFENPVVDGQNGATVYTGAQVTENAADFCKASVTQRTILGAGSTQTPSGSGN